MSGNIYGPLNGPEIPKTVDRSNRKLPLGPVLFKIGKPIEKVSKSGDSINVAFPVHSTDAHTKGSAFLRLNFRNTSFTVGSESFGGSYGYFDPEFLTNGLTRLKELSNQPGEVGTAATKELNRANMVLSDIRKLRDWGSLPNSGGFAPAELEGVEARGIVRYVDQEDRILTQKYDKPTDSYVTICLKKTIDPNTGKTKMVEIDTALFNLQESNAEIGRLLYKPKDTDANATAGSEAGA